MTLWPLHQPPACVFDVVLNLAHSLGLGRYLRVSAGDCLAHESRDQDQPALLDRSVRSFIAQFYDAGEPIDEINGT
ncbi:MAG TPA: hypothetical protein DCY64_12460 [Hydrogenophaga sp.]|nr:MAG: hypothetical protein A2X73_14080 [Burkholderiales bacterium GWE1_65_30]OGA91956.1 MAG: hypothetical protein A2X72_15575 [Burkholderiales bacterium GWF1_66_17]HAX21081.1 hypothetical protein [Hydrogenophaga sp.]HBU18989.1 hypothetical protein [Hydrogenophaga sp.]